MANKLQLQKLGPFTGIMFEIRRVSMAAYMQELKDLPFSLAPGTAEELEKLRDGSAVEKLTPQQKDDLNRKTLNLFLSQGIVRMKYPDEDWQAPNIWFGAGECPESHVTVADLGSDADIIAAEVGQYSFNLKGVKALEGFFRDQQQSATGPSGEEIRDASVESPSA